MTNSVTVLCNGTQGIHTQSSCKSEAFCSPVGHDEPGGNRTWIIHDRLGGGGGIPKAALKAKTFQPVTKAK